MKILATNWQDLRNPHAGGAEIHLFEILSRLARRGHRVRVICCGYPGAPATESINGIEVERHGGRHSFAMLASRAIASGIRAFAPDVVVDDVNKLPLFAPLLTSRPVYAIIPHLFGEIAFDEVAWPMAAMVWGAERLIPRVYDRAWFHAISDSTRDDLVARGIPSERIAVVYPGVDSRHFCPDPARPRATPARFTYIGRLKRYKGVEFLIEALAVVRRSRPEVTVDIAGSGDDRGRLERLAAARGLAEAVRFRGFVDETQRLSLLRESMANVFPSPKEGWGITVMEAAACGTPSIASDSPGLRDSVRDGRTGILVPHGNIERLAQEMLRMVNEPGLADRLGAAARLWAEQLTWDGAADAVEAHLTALANGQPLSALTSTPGVTAALP